MGSVLACKRSTPLQLYGMGTAVWRKKRPEGSQSEERSHGTATKDRGEEWWSGFRRWSSISCVGPDGSVVKYLRYSWDFYLSHSILWYLCHLHWLAFCVKILCGKLKLFWGKMVRAVLGLYSNLRYFQTRVIKSKCLFVLNLGWWIRSGFLVSLLTLSLRTMSAIWDF